MIDARPTVVGQSVCPRQFIRSLFLLLFMYSFSSSFEFHVSMGIKFYAAKKLRIEMKINSKDEAFANVAASFTQRAL